LPLTTFLLAHRNDMEPNTLSRNQQPLLLHNHHPGHGFDHDALILPTAGCRLREASAIASPSCLASAVSLIQGIHSCLRALQQRVMSWFPLRIVHGPAIPCPQSAIARTALGLHLHLCSLCLFGSRLSRANGTNLHACFDQGVSRSNVMADKGLFAHR